MKRARYILTIFIILFAVLPIVGQDLLPENFDEWIQEGMEQWEIPGMAIAIVKDGQVVLTEGYGVRRLDGPERVDADTQFGIASVSKHMTASSLAILVDEEKLQWNDPVTKHVPWFKLSDPWATEHITIHDLLTHQVGIGRILGNRLQFMTDRSRDELLYRMRYHDFEQPFRAGYVYSNVMYTLAGEVVAAVTGQSWDSFMTERFFEPMEMHRTNTSVDDLHEDGNAAWPHQYIKGEVVPIPRRNWDVASPAGGVNSTANDMARWMQMQLDLGSFKGNQLISNQAVTTIQTPKVTQGTNGVTEAQRSYGYGFNITDHRGYRMISHGGATDGMNTSYTLIPEQNFGIIVMSNTFNQFMGAVTYTVIDHILGETDRDWNQLYFELYTNNYGTVKTIREQFEATRISDTTPTHEPEAYTGRFHNDLYDQADIRLENDGLVLTVFDDENLTGDLEHWHHNTFRINWRNPAQREEFLKFDMNYEGEIDALEIRYTLRPMLLQVGAYPTTYYRDVRYERVE
jgi:CubicO group peptidase (beta-lactamase class C family)